MMIYVIFLFKKTYFGWSLLKNDPCNIPAGNAIKQYKIVHQNHSKSININMIKVFKIFKTFN